MGKRPGWVFVIPVFQPDSLAQSRAPWLVRNSTKRERRASETPSSTLTDHKTQHTKTYSGTNICWQAIQNHVVDYFYRTPAHLLAKLTSTDSLTWQVREARAGKKEENQDESWKHRNLRVSAPDTGKKCAVERVEQNCFVPARAWTCLKKGLRNVPKEAAWHCWHEATMEEGMRSRGHKEHKG